MFTKRLIRSYGGHKNQPGQNKQAQEISLSDLPRAQNNEQPRKNKRHSGRNQAKQLRSNPADENGHKKTGSDSLKIYPLGGQEEVGRNCTVFEYDNDIIILDMGIQFPDEDMPGIDYIIPNTESLENKKHNIRGVLFSHGHLDHIGAAPMMLENLGNPLIIGRNLTLALIKNRQEDYKRNTAKNLKTLLIKSLDQKIKLGKFKISFFQVDHSIMDAMGVIIETPHGTIIHPGDWTMEVDPMENNPINYDKLLKLPSPRILMLESLGVTYDKPPVPIKITLRNLQNLIDSALGRIIIGTFSSQIERIKYLLEHAEKVGKKVAVDGYSMKMNVEIAKELGYIKVHKETLIGVDKIHQYPDNKIIVICTGAQGESNAVFSRIVNNNHRYIKIQKNDTVVFSSSIIPGNEESVQKLKDQVYHLTENVIHNEIMDVHTGGHATSADIVKVINQIKPDYFIPVYANYYMLIEAKKLAMRNGLRENQIFILENGNILEFKNGRPNLHKEKVNTDYVMVDGLGVGDISNVVLRDRQVMSDEGMIVVIATIYNKNSKLVGNPDIISRGFIHMKENKDLVESTRKKVREIVESGSTKTKTDENFIKNKLRNDLGQFLFQKTQRRPMVLPVIIKV
ncbi:hypothetical protein COT99_01375 [Candidatus Falkowbacteria bacterium CG10_big_fil_rev_8_21_14_0_10_43_10]|uniref:Metallo-beta-lactamase domain-containing protein n=1 Tax=Candidatus Falkowbacteria bacterium CG10_big_fil_rev_8_21_14_0_10_43_10 TaxID=1974567 RepID=A0A2H0V2K6_9BACT|nr:MAG: hypothetical protein COT99_01375 [Candidatus Falkowbacteria bacterium CG10_big_fil_rev_8_21_14_0_10_43_10]